MQFANERDRELFEKIESRLINTKYDLDSISMFCPFCQIGGSRKNSKKWSPSQRKGYILNNHSKGYDFAVFYCHNSQCDSRILSRGSGGLSLEVFANYILGQQIGTHRKSSSLVEVTSETQKRKSSDHQRNMRSKIQVLPPSNRNQQSGLGAALDRKVKTRKNSRRNLYE